MTNFKIYNELFYVPMYIYIRLLKGYFEEMSSAINKRELYTLKEYIKTSPKKKIIEFILKYKTQ